MSAATQGSEKSGVETGARDGSDSPIIVDDSVSEKSVKVTPGSAGGVTDDDLLGRSEDEKDVYSECSSYTMVGERPSHPDEDFDPYLPTRYGDISQATPVKDVVVEKAIDNGKSEKKLPIDDGKSEKKLPIEEGKSEKKVPALVKKESTESAETSKPTAKLEIMTPPITKEETEVRLHGKKVLADLGHITMLTKKHFKDSGHLKSGRYYPSEAPLLTM